MQEYTNDIFLYTFIHRLSDIASVSHFQVINQFFSLVIVEHNYK